ncbi:hypothetical protein [Tissierella pigra]|uniref:Fibronectin type-III domain-containing protein n=1 Tax=Tissierella pigra TaxID=2607614 RepID=A0A6N7XQU7_9FIRM|nr:hypothetical protein [Tissierella pigra]MSU03202.1 hypothetical protein [Tissierella pigra]
MAWLNLGEFEPGYSNVDSHWISIMVGGAGTPDGRSGVYYKKTTDGGIGLAGSIQLSGTPIRSINSTDTLRVLLDGEYYLLAGTLDFRDVDIPTRDGSNKFRYTLQRWERPAAPSSITVPASLKSNTPFTVSWGASSGGSKTYTLERSINGGAWVVILSNTVSLSKSETPLSTWSTVVYRVRAYDTVAFSSYTTSPTRTGINNTAPTTPSITVPTTVRGGETLSITWGASTDTDGNLSGYILERSVNGAAYTQIYKGANRSFTDSITRGWNTVAYRVKAYDSEGAESGYTTSATRTVINNTAPSINGQDSNLGDKNLGFVISYQVDDIDAGDSLVVTEKLNNSTLRTINGAPRRQQLEIEITNEMLFNLGLNSTNTIEIKVDDQQGGIAYRRFTFRRTNSAPTIDGQDKDLGKKTEPFSIDFSVSDNEGNAITVKTYLNNILKEEYQAIDGATNTFTISSEDWYKLKIGQHNIRIEARDEHGATAVRNYTFTRYDDKIQFTLKTPIETDIMGTKILVTPTWTIPAGATAKVEACNNAFDEVPTWEDITSQVNISRHYNFTNDVKTADKWGINIKVSIEKGTATEECIINGFGGAFE